MGVRNAKREELGRLECKTLDAQFRVVNQDDLNCSPFEAETVIDAVKEVYGPNLNGSSDSLPPGTMRLVAVDADEPAGKPVAAAIAALPWLPTESVQEPETIRMTGTFDDGTAQRAAPAQRALRPIDQLDTRMCSEGESDAQQGTSSLPIEFAKACAAIHDNSTKRVMGLEPTTFTLAT